MDAAAFEALAQTYGTPFFLYDADEINARIHAIKLAFSGMVKVFYAVKANPNLALLRAVSATADGLDISSAGELEQARLAGFDAAKLSFAGPAKTSAELTDAIQRSIGCISIESMRELMECVRIARQMGNKANVAVRINPVLLNRSFGMKMGGKAVQFGIDEEDLGDVLRAIVAHPNELEFQGIHIYAGSQCFDPAGVVEGVQNTFRIAREVEHSAPLICRTINLGGGFGVSHVDDQRELDLATLAAALRPVIAAFIEHVAGSEGNCVRTWPLPHRQCGDLCLARDQQQVVRVASNFSWSMGACIIILRPRVRSARRSGPISCCAT